LIHNGKCGPTPAIGSLPVALIKSSFQGFSMAEVCSSTLLSAGFGAATLIAILLAVIAAAADPENRVTFVPTAKPLAENIFRVASHSHSKARLDKRHPNMSAYGRLNMEPLDQRFYQWTPVADYDRGLLCSTFRKRLHEDDEEVHAFGVDDVEESIPAGVQINTFSDDR